MLYTHRLIRLLSVLLLGLLCSLATAEPVIDLDVPLVDAPHSAESNLSRQELAALRARREKAASLQRKVLWLFEQKRYDDAQDICEKIVDLVPEDGTAWYNLACAHARLGKADLAIKNLNEAVTRGFVEIRHMESDPDLTSLRRLDAFHRLLAKRNQVQRDRAERIRRELHRRYGSGYIIEVDHDSRLVFATNTDRETINGLRDDLTSRAKALWRQLFDHRLEQYVTIIIPEPGSIPMGRVGGVFRRSDATIVAQRVGMTCRHEFTHALHFADMEARAQLHPIWILEGLATLYETADFQRGDLHALPNDRLNALQFYLARDRLKPLATLLEVDQAGFMQDASVYYAMSRYLMMYLERKGKLRAWYQAYTAGYDQDETGRRALEKVFGKRLDEIERDWQTWVARLPRATMVVRTNQPYIGVAVTPVTEGLQVERVVPGSGGAKAGLRTGDLIVRVDGRQLADGTELIRLVTQREVGDRLKIRYRRNGRYATAMVQLQPKPGELPVGDASPAGSPIQDKNAKADAPDSRPPFGVGAPSQSPMGEGAPSGSPIPMKDDGQGYHAPDRPDRTIYPPEPLAARPAA